MQTVSMQEIQTLYSRCGLAADGIGQVRREIHTGSLNNKLNSDFSNIYGKNCSNNVTITKR